MPARPVPDRFKVAFSFAGEQRDLVRAIAQSVEARLGAGTVFLDEWFEYYLAGDDADLKLQAIYGERCDLAVVCVSQRYGGKPWTRAEYAAIRARLMQARASADERDGHAILPIRVGEGEVPGILFNTIVPDVRERTPEQAAELIVERLGLVVPGLAVGSTATPVGPPPTSVPPAAPAPHRASQRKALTEALDQLARQYEAAIQQSVNAIDAVATVQAQRQAELLEQRMQEIAGKLAG